MKKNVVLHVIPQLNMGGAESTVANYSLFNTNKNTEIIILSLEPNHNSMLSQKLSKQSKKVIYLNKKPGFSLRTIFDAWNVIIKIRPTVIHTHLSSLIYTILPTLLLSIKARFHTIHSEVDVDAQKLVKIVNYLCFKFLRVIPIALHSKMKDDIDSIYHINNTICIPNGVNEKRFVLNHYKIKEIYNSINSVTNDTVIFGHVGSFYKVKNHVFIIELFEKIVNELPNSVLILVGEGPEMNKIKSMCNEMELEGNVRFLGLREDIPELMFYFDCFLFPSLYEGMPLSLLEAQMAGTKCIISSEIDDQIIINKNVYSYKLDDMSGWLEEALTVEKEKIRSDKIHKYSLDYILESIYTEYDRKLKNVDKLKK